MVSVYILWNHVYNNIMTKKTNLWICLSVFFFSMAVFHTWRNSVTFLDLKLKQPQPSGPPKRDFHERNDEKIYILVWNNYWKWPDYGLGEENEGFKAHNCSFTNCFLSLDKKKVKKVDAILIHGHGMASTHSLRRTIKSTRHKARNGWPLVVYFNKESAM